MAMATVDPELVVQLQLYVSCEGLKNMDKLSKSDPMVVCTQKTDSGEWVEVGRTEMVKDNLSPRFATAISIAYHFEEIQLLKFTVVDVDDPKGKLEDQDMIGELETQLGKIVGSRGSCLAAPLVSAKHKKPGDISITSEQAETHTVSDYTMRFSAKHLDKKGSFICFVIGFLPPTPPPVFFLFSDPFSALFCLTRWVFFCR
jgi:copine 1/2/3